MIRHVVDIAVAAALFVAAVALWFVADGFPRFARYRDIDSDFWPKALMVLIAVFALVLFVQSVQALRLARLKARAGGTGPALEDGGGGSDVVWARLLVAAALTVAYVLALRYVGFIVATVAFLAVAQNIVRYPNVWVKVIFPVAFTAALGVLFVRVMALSLPRGTGVFYEFSLLFY